MLFYSYIIKAKTYQGKNVYRMEYMMTGMLTKGNIMQVRAIGMTIPNVMRERMKDES
jgi:hypothetical protein